jgi:hypothetical protein
MQIKISKDLKEQMVADNLTSIWIRDFISYEIDLQGNITPEIETTFKKEYLEKLENGLVLWFNSLKSDYEFYKNIDQDCINIHFDDITSPKILQSIFN